MQELLPAGSLITPNASDSAPPRASGAGNAPASPSGLRPTQVNTPALAMSNRSTLLTNPIPPAGAMVSPSEVAARAKFLPPNDARLRTAIIPRSNTEPSMPAVRDRLLPDQGDHQIVLPVPELSGPQLDPPKIWVAAHKAPTELDPRLILVREPDSARAAAYRVLRHRLQGSGNPRIIAVTSPGRGDGKTTCAVNLALALGECERARVLLIEANLRDPQLAALFGFLPPECFAVQMARHKERPADPWSVVEAFSPALHVLAVKPGPRAENEQALLDGPAFLGAVFSLARGDYDYVVLDTPPVLGSADVNLVEDAADGVLLAARAGQTSTRDLRRAVHQLAPTKILGFTLIDA